MIKNMDFRRAKLRVKELSEALQVESSDVIAVCALLKIPASSTLSILSIEQCKEIIDYIQT